MSQIITGANGAGKTNLAVKRAVFDAISSGRPIYYTQIELYPDVINSDNNSNVEFIELTPEEMYNWQDQVVSPSILLCDEAQKIWRDIEMKREVRKSGEMPQCIAQFETHRHHGHDFYFTAQNPAQLFDGIRQVIDQYVHIVNYRQFYRKIYEWPEFRSPASQGNRNDAEMSIRKPHKKAFRWYKSTKLNTRKMRVPKVFKLLFFAALGLPIMSYTIWNTTIAKKFNPPTETENKPEQQPGESETNEYPDLYPEDDHQRASEKSPLDATTVINSPVPDEIIFKPLRGVNHLTSAAYHEIAILPSPVAFSGCIDFGETCLCVDVKAQLIPVDYAECIQYLNDKSSNTYRFDGYTTRDIEAAEIVEIDFHNIEGGVIEEAVADDMNNDRAKIVTVPFSGDSFIKADYGG